MKKQFKTLILLAVLAFTILSPIQSAAHNTIKVLVNNAAVNFDQPPVIENGRTLVPMRAIFEALDAEVTWDSENRIASGQKNGIHVTLSIGSPHANINGSTVEMDVPGKIVGERTMVPLRFIAESLNCFVGWQENTKTIYITDGENKPQRNLSVHYLDVGQGDSALVMLPNGQNMLIDAGNKSDAPFIVDYIKSMNIQTLDYVVATHPHADHIGGMETVINVFDIGKVYMPKITHTTKTFADLLGAIQNKGLGIHTAKAGVNIINTNGLCIDFAAPVLETYKNSNDYSAVLKLTYLNDRFLFMGDAEKLSEGQITADIEADVLKIGHHGSDTSTSPEFLNKVSPQYAVISVGKANTYGHPSQTVLKLLESKQIVVYRTDLQGTIVATTKGEGLTIKALQKTALGDSESIQNKEDAGFDFDDTYIVYVTKSGSKYHSENCSSLSSSKIPLPLSEAVQKYEPCAKCNPLK